MDWVVFDVEIQKTIESLPRGWDQTEDMGVAVACLWEMRSERMRIYGPNELEELRSRLLRADRISGFNIWKFDYPVVWGYSKKEWSTVPGPATLFEETSADNLKRLLAPKTDDALRRIWQSLGLNPDVFSDAHKGWGLDAVAKWTLNAGKIGNGADAPKWYQAGEIQRVASYCADDVALERDLALFIEKYGYVVNNGKVLQIKKWGGA